MQLIPGTGYQRAGKTSRILVSGLPLTYASWRVSMSSTKLDTMNFESYNVATGESFGEGLHDGLEAGLTGGGDWDAHAAPYGDPPGLYVRDDLPNLLYYTSRIDNVGWVFPLAQIISSENGAEVKGKVTFSFAGNSQGPFLLPEASV